MGKKYRVVLTLDKEFDDYFEAIHTAKCCVRNSYRFNSSNDFSDIRIYTEGEDSYVHDIKYKDVIWRNSEYSFKLFKDTISYYVKDRGFELFIAEYRKESPWATYEESCEMNFNEYGDIVFTTYGTRDCRISSFYDYIPEITSQQYLRMYFKKYYQIKVAFILKEEFYLIVRNPKAVEPTPPVQKKKGLKKLLDGIR